MKLTEELRKVHHIGNAEPIYVIHTTMNEDELRQAILTARQRERIFECAALAVIGVLALLAELIFKEVSVIGCTVLCAFLIIQRIADARQHTNQAIGKLHDHFGFARSEYTIWLFEERVLVYEHIWDVYRGYVYAHFIKVYQKKSFLFLCWEKRKGYFIRYADIPDHEKLIRFLKEKNPKMEIKK